MKRFNGTNNLEGHVKKSFNSLSRQNRNNKLKGFNFYKTFNLSTAVFIKIVKTNVNNSYKPRFLARLFLLDHY